MYVLFLIFVLLFCYFVFFFCFFLFLCFCPIVSLLLAGVAIRSVLSFLSRFGIVFRTFHWSCRMVFYFLMAFDWPLTSRQRSDLFEIAFFFHQPNADPSIICVLP